MLACDLVVAARTASFGLPEVKRGLVPTCGGLFRTPRALPLNVAKEMLLTGDRLAPERAYALGLVNVVTEPGGAVAGALALAERICAVGPVGARASLRALERTVAERDELGWEATVARHGGDRRQRRHPRRHGSRSSRSASRDGRDGNERSDRPGAHERTAAEPVSGSAGSEPSSKRQERRSMSEDVILVDVADRVAVVTLNRPESRNALNPALTAALPEAIAACDARDDVDAIVLTGADPAFCAGVDLKALTTDSEVRHIVRSEDELIRPFPETTKPVIGAINGAAVTGGFEVALTCDFLVASERARFADTHARVGIMPGWGLTVLLAEAIGQRRAREMSVTGNFVDAPHRAGVGPGQPRRAPRGVAAVLPPARHRHRVERPARRSERARDVPRAGALHRPRHPAHRAPPLPGVAGDRRAASPTRWRGGESAIMARGREQQALTWPSRRSESRCPTPSSTRCTPRSAGPGGPTRSTGAGWDYGTELGYLQELVGYWADGFDWHAREEVLNSLPQYRTEVDAPGFERFGAALRAPAGRRTGTAAAAS